MTQEEAIERIKSRYDKWALDDKDLEAIASFIPELVDSEDERIRRFLVELVSNDKFNDYCGLYKERNVPYDDVLAYLEKRKDVSKAIEAVDRIDKYIDEHTVNAHDMSDSIPDKKYYQGWDDALGKIAGILQDVYSVEKQKEQKPAEWNDEDNRNYEYLHQIICNYINNPQIEYKEREKASKELIPFWEKLKSLCPQPKEEWNEGDKDMITLYLHDKDGGMLWSEATEIAEDILGMIHPHPHWKPSEEQMDALNEAVGDFRVEDTASCEKTADILESLYYALQKL